MVASLGTAREHVQTRNEEKVGQQGVGKIQDRLGQTRPAKRYLHLSECRNLKEFVP